MCDCSGWEVGNMETNDTKGILCDFSESEHDEVAW